VTCLVLVRWLCSPASRYDTHNVKPAFPFGHGLSYTSFGYSGLVVGDYAASANATTVTVDVANTGPIAGAEVAQLYLAFPVAAGEPPRQLKGLKKLPLNPGEKKTVTFALRDRDVSVWSTATHSWEKVKGDFGVFVGASSRDIRQTGKLTVS
jgi:beta-glucosidase